MKYTIENFDTKSDQCFEINLDKNCFKSFKNYVKQNKLNNDSNLNNLPLKFVIDFTSLNLGKMLYGSSKTETKQIQKENVKQLIQVYKITTKILRFANRHFKNQFSTTLFVENLTNRKNNNHKMLEFMINTSLCTPFFKKTSTAINYACNYLDLENSEHNMCDFKDNRCSKHRARDFKTTTGCCPKTCKFMCTGPCKTKNISCKLIMCDYLEEKGFYFFPNALGILRIFLSPAERIVVWGLFFKSDKKVNFIIWFVRFLGFLGVLAILKLLLGIII